MAFEGANPDQLDSLANALNGLADRLNSTRSDLNSRVHSSSWRGPAADRFRGEWNSNYSRSLDNVVTSLRDATGVLHTNSNQQRTASGEQTKNYGTVNGLVRSAEKAVAGAVRTEQHGIASLFRSAEKGVSSAARTVEHGTVNAVHSAEHVAGEVIAANEAAYKTIVSSQAFADAIKVAQVVSAVAPFLAFVPIVGPEAALALTAAASVAVVIGKAAQMANTGKWNYEELGVDAASGVLALAGAGALGTAARMGSDVDLVSNLTKDVGAFPAVQRTMVVVQTAKSGVEIAHSSVTVTTDLYDHHYVKAAEDSTEMGDAAGGILGGGGPDASVSRQLVEPGLGAVDTGKDVVTH